MNSASGEAASSTSQTSGEALAELSFLAMATELLRNRRFLAGTVGFSVVVFVALGLLSSSQYSTATTFVTQSTERQAGQLSGVAAQFGISLPSGGGSQSPQFYADLLTSRKLLRETVESTYNLPVAGGDSVREVTLLDYFGVEGEERASRAAQALGRLSEQISVSQQPETGTVELRVSTSHPDLSQQVAQQMLDLVNRFNLETRQTQAAAERRFTAERLEQARGDLRAAEDSLQRFLERNRQYQNSPHLRFEHERLQRRVALQQEVVTSLARSLEQAKIDEVRNTPVITVVDPPERPPYPDSRNLILRAVLGLLFGVLIGVFWLMGRAFLKRSRDQEPERYEQLRELAGETVRGLKGMLSSRGGS